jgi:hypothetical protein
MKDFLPENLYNAITNPEIINLFVRAAAEEGAELLSSNSTIGAAIFLLTASAFFLNQTADQM